MTALRISVSSNCQKYFFSSTRFLYFLLVARGPNATVVGTDADESSDVTVNYERANINVRASEGEVTLRSYRYELFQVFVSLIFMTQRVIQLLKWHFLSFTVWFLPIFSLFEAFFLCYCRIVADVMFEEPARDRAFVYVWSSAFRVIRVKSAEAMSYDARVAG